jgi:hypothetical protein
LVLLLLLFFLRHVMPDHTTGRGPGNRMVASDMTRDSTYDGAFDTTLREHRLRAHEECEAEQGRGEQWPLRLDGPGHTLYPLRLLECRDFNPRESAGSTRGGEPTQLCDEYG